MPLSPSPRCESSSPPTNYWVGPPYLTALHEIKRTKGVRDNLLPAVNPSELIPASYFLVFRSPPTALAPCSVALLTAAAVACFCASAFNPSTSSSML